MLSEISKSSVQPLGSFAVGFARFFFCTKQTQIMAFSVCRYLGDPFFAAFVVRNSFIPRSIAFSFYLVKTVLRVVGRSYFFVVKRVSGYMVHLGCWPFASFDKKNKPVDEVVTLANFDVAIPVRKHISCQFATSAVTSLARPTLTGGVFPKKFASFFIVAKKRASKFGGDIVFCGGHINILFLGGVVSR